MVPGHLVIGDDSDSRSHSVVIHVVSRLCLVECPSYAPVLPSAELELVVCVFYWGGSPPWPNARSALASCILVCIYKYSYCVIMHFLYLSFMFCLFFTANLFQHTLSIKSPSQCLLIYKTSEFSTIETVSKTPFLLATCMC